MVVEPLQRGFQRATLQSAVDDAADLVAFDETSFLKDVQMLDEAGERHAERVGQRADGLLTDAKAREHGAARGVGQRAEDAVETGACIVNHMVHFMRTGGTCQVTHV